MNEYTHIKRNFDALYDSLSSILILGSFPSVKSRQAAFYYGHPQNRFWKLMSMLLNCDIPNNIDSKKAIMLQNHIALWDTIEECDIIGSSDSSIKNVVPVDIARIINTANIKAIFCNGNASYNLFMKYLYHICEITPVKLPSTSPANAAWSLSRLYDAWSNALSPYIKNEP